MNWSPREIKSQMNNCGWHKSCSEVNLACKNSWHPPWAALHHLWSTPVKEASSGFSYRENKYEQRQKHPHRSTMLAVLYKLLDENNSFPLEFYKLRIQMNQHVISYVKCQWEDRCCNCIWQKTCPYQTLQPESRNSGVRGKASEKPGLAFQSLWHFAESRESEYFDCRVRLLCPDA